MSKSNSSNKIRKVLVVDDDSDIVELLTYNLKKEGYEVMTAYDGKEAVKCAKTFLPDLILLDIMMPKMDGVEACRLLRDDPAMTETYIIFLTARAEEYSEVAAFDAGANDYLTKPIRPRALMSRIQSIFQNYSHKGSGNDDVDRIVVADFIIDKSSYTLHKDEKQINLPKKELELLYFLAKNPNKVFSRDLILKNIWGTDVFVLPRTVDVHIRRIREKIGEGHIKTIKGVGYKFMIS